MGNRQSRDYKISQNNIVTCIFHGLRMDTYLSLWESKQSSEQSWFSSKETSRLLNTSLECSNYNTVLSAPSVLTTRQLLQPSYNSPDPTLQTWQEFRCDKYTIIDGIKWRCSDIAKNVWTIFREIAIIGSEHNLREKFPSFWSFFVAAD